jgi:uncharacterized membrane protein YidH (DUF202 family)
MQYLMGVAFVAAGAFGIFSRDTLQRISMQSQSRIRGRRPSDASMLITRLALLIACVVIMVFGFLAIFGITDLRRR